MPARRALLLAATAAAASYLATLVAVPLLRPEIDVLRTRPEHYANGPTESLVRIGYASCAVMAAAIAAEPREVTGGALLGGVFALVAGPLLLSYGERARVGRLSGLLAAGVVVTFLSLAVVPREVAGLANRAFDVLLACWGIAIATAAVRRGSTIRAPNGPMPPAVRA